MIPGLAERTETFQVDNVRKGIPDRKEPEQTEEAERLKDVTVLKRHLGSAAGGPCACLGVGVKVAGNGIRTLRYLEIGLLQR